jgi:hypothetical protein
MDCIDAEGTVNLLVWDSSGSTSASKPTGRSVFSLPGKSAPERTGKQCTPDQSSLKQRSCGKRLIRNMLNGIRGAIENLSGKNLLDKGSAFS